MASVEKTFIVCGVSSVKGKVKMRCANDLNRAKVLERANHTDIMLVALDIPLTELQIAHFLKNNTDFNTLPENVDAFDSVIAKYEKLTHTSEQSNSDTIPNDEVSLLDDMIGETAANNSAAAEIANMNESGYFA